jgi:hypothetical protein
MIYLFSHSAAQLVNMKEFTAAKVQGDMLDVAMVEFVTRQVHCKFIARLGY